MMVIIQAVVVGVRWGLGGDGGMDGWTDGPKDRVLSGVSIRRNV
jgi:hypothetical protein